jgi:hypothetical protein
LLLHHTAWFAWLKGNMIEAKKMAVKAIKTRAKLLGQDHESTLNSITMVGLVLNSQGKYKEAKVMH